MQTRRPAPYSGPGKEANHPWPAQESKPSMAGTREQTIDGQNKRANHQWPEQESKPSMSGALSAKKATHQWPGPPPPRHTPRRLRCAAAVSRRERWYDRDGTVCCFSCKRSGKCVRAWMTMSRSPRPHMAGMSRSSSCCASPPPCDQVRTQEQPPSRSKRDIHIAISVLMRPSVSALLDRFKFTASSLGVRRSILWVHLPSVEPFFRNSNLARELTLVGKSAPAVLMR
jgi:hypothetical protein